MHNLGRGDVDGLAELSKIVFAIECFAADFLQDFTKIVMNIWDSVGVS